MSFTGTTNPQSPVFQPRLALPIATTSKPDEDLTSKFGQFELRILSHSPTYQKLFKLKTEYSKDTFVSEDFANRRKQYSLDILQNTFRDQFESIFADINDVVDGYFGKGDIKDFLDLGCAPGGFSKFVMENNPNARGVGITLPSLAVLADGTPLADPTRYRFEQRDLTMLNFDAQTFRPPSARVDLSKDGYDLIIAGAFPTRQAISAPERAILALSQLHAILSNLRPGATCVLIANTKLFLWNVEMFAVLRRVFGRIQPAKHRELHAIRSSCYFVCMGFMTATDIDDEQRQLMKRKVRCALEVLKTVEVTGPANKEWTEKLLIFSDDFDLDRFFSNEHRFFLDIMEPLWEKQFAAIEGSLAKAQQSPRRGSFKGNARFGGYPHQTGATPT